jgi:hypothetical protein
MEAGPCTATSDAMTVTVSNPFTANAGADQIVCGASAVSISGNAATGGNWTGGTGTFNPNRNTANATYTPSVPEIGTIVTLTWDVPDPDGAGPCSASSDGMTITINNAAVANAGGDKAVCGVTAVTLSGTAATGGNWSGGNGIFNPNRNTATATYTPSISEIGTTVILTWNVPDPGWKRTMHFVIGCYDSNGKPICNCQCRT